MLEGFKAKSQEKPDVCSRCFQSNSYPTETRQYKDPTHSRTEKNKDSFVTTCCNSSSELEFESLAVSLNSAAFYPLGEYLESYEARLGRSSGASSRLCAQHRRLRMPGAPARLKRH